MKVFICGAYEKKGEMYSQFIAEQFFPGTNKWYIAIDSENADTHQARKTSSDVIYEGFQGIQRFLIRKKRSVKLIGRGEKIRTSDPYNPIVVRYQAALRPDRGADSTWVLI